MTQGVPTGEDRTRGHQTRESLTPELGTGVKTTQGEVTLGPPW